MHLERKAYDFEIKAKSDDGGQFEGYASCFHVLDSYNDIVAPGAFRDSIPDFLANGIVAWQHDWTTPIGKPLSAEENDKGLYTKAMISDTAMGRDARTLMRDGVVKKLSIGFQTKGREWLDDEDAVKAYWQGAGYTPDADEVARSQYGARLITKARLYEYSPVSVPANARCDVTQVKGMPEGRSLDDRSAWALGALEEHLADVEAYLDMCRKDGRSPSLRRQASFKRLQDRLGELLRHASDSPDVSERSAEVVLDAGQLHAKFLEINARFLGVG